MAELPEGFDLDALLAPVNDEAPAGADLREDFSPASPYFRLRDARAEARAAERQLAQATALIGQAEAQRYPNVSLSGTLSTSASPIPFTSPPTPRPRPPATTPSARPVGAPPGAAGGSGPARWRAAARRGRAPPGAGSCPSCRA